mmetsp:Transcript_31908/g.88195  ORF Transcript_31908/g.88195 Transcript_31908/m.88195 type:complete len:205 (+) Transcript_31908:736-1350(+)
MSRSEFSANGRHIHTPRKAPAEVLPEPLLVPSLRLVVELPYRAARPSIDERDVIRAIFRDATDHGAHELREAADDVDVQGDSGRHVRSLDLDCHGRAIFAQAPTVNLPQGGCRDGLRRAGNAFEDVVYVAAELRLNGGAGQGPWKSGTIVAKSLELLEDRGRQQVGADSERLPQLDESRPKPRKRLAGLRGVALAGGLVGLKYA